jgi:hypothetical protein
MQETRVAPADRDDATAAPTLYVAAAPQQDQQPGGHHARVLGWTISGSLGE